MLNRRDFLRGLIGTGFAVSLSGTASALGINKPARLIKLRLTSANKLSYMNMSVTVCAASETNICFFGTGLNSRLIGQMVEEHYKKFAESGIMRISQDTEGEDEIIFLAGEVDNSDFMALRETVLSRNPYFLWTIAFAKGGQPPFTPEKNECLILYPHNAPVRNGFILIRDILSAISLPGVIGIDSSDLQYASGGRVARHEIIESARDVSLKHLAGLIKRNLRCLKECSGLMYLTSYKDDSKILEEIGEHGSQILKCISSSAELFVSAPQYPILESEFAASLVMTFEPDKKGLFL